MQIKIFTIPVVGGEQLNEEMNVFLRSEIRKNITYPDMIQQGLNGLNGFNVGRERLV